MNEDTLSLYMLTYYRETAKSQFKPSGVIVQEIGTDRFEFEIDDIGCSEVVGHYIRLIQQGQCIIPQTRPETTPIESLKYHLGSREYSQYDTNCKIGTVFQVVGDPVQVLREKYDEHVKKSCTHPTDSIN